MSIRAVQCWIKTKHDMHSWLKDRQEVFCLGVEVVDHIPIPHYREIIAARAAEKE